MSGLQPCEIQRRQELIRSYLRPQFDVRIICNPESPRFLNSVEDFTVAVTSIHEYLRRQTLDDVEVLLFGGAIDPGLKTLREGCSVPIVGPGEAALYLASVLRRPISIIVVSDGAVGVAEEFVRSSAVSVDLASIRTLGSTVGELIEDPESLRHGLFAECAKAVEHDGAEAVLLGSISLATLDVVETLRGQLGVAILDPLKIGSWVAMECCGGRVC